MKYREGFITNSSSSSFVGVFAKITNPNKAKNVIEKYSLQNKVMLGAQLDTQDEDDFKCEWANVDLLDNNNLPDLKKNNSWDTLFLLWRAYEREWDYGYEDSDSYEDFDFSELSSLNQEIYNAINSENGFEVLGSGYGVGYNG